jgi:hypothetical protein
LSYFDPFLWDSGKRPLVPKISGVWPAFVSCTPVKNDGRVRSVDLVFADLNTGAQSVLESQSIDNIAPPEVDLTAAVDLSLENLKKAKREKIPKPKEEKEIVQINSQWLNFV